MSDFTVMLRPVPGSPVKFKVAYITPSEELQNKIKLAVEGSKYVIKVKDDKEMGRAIGVVSELKQITADIDTARRAIKAPFADAVKLIDQTARDLNQGILEAVARIESLIGEFRGEQLRKEKAEQARLAHISDQLTLASHETADPNKKEKLEAVSAEMFVRSQEAVKATPGAAIRNDYVLVRLTDFVKVANTNPELLRQEVNLSALRDRIRGLTDGGRKEIELDCIPGILLARTTVVGVHRNSGRPPLLP